MTPVELPREPERRRSLESVATPGAGASWIPLDLRRVVEGGSLGDPPVLLARDDDVLLLYPGRIHSVSGEPETGKGWLALYATAERLHVGEHVLYIDFEDSPEGIVGRLLALGVSGDVILARFHYLRPDEPLDDRGREALDAALAANPALVVVDGLTEAYALHGLEPKDNLDAARWLELVPRRIVRCGAAVLQLDHVGRDKEARGRFALGAQHKLAGVDVAYRLELAKSFGRGREGMAALRVSKDRPGFVRRHAEGDLVAILRLTSAADGSVTDIGLAPPEPDFRPTVLMERVSRAVEREPGISKRGIRDVKGKNDAKDRALELLLDEGFVRQERAGQAVRHYSVKPYREGDEPTVPHRAPTVPPSAGARLDDSVPEECAVGTPRTGHGVQGVQGEPDGPTVPPERLATPEEEAEAERLRRKGEEERS